MSNFDAASFGAVRRMCEPSPFALVTAEREDGGTNIAAFSWWTFLSNNPPTIGLCTSNAKYTGECIRRSGEFVLCIPGENLEEKAMLCGQSSGRDVDKAAKYDIKLVPCGAGGAMAVDGSRAAFRCALVSCVPVSDHTLYIASVTESFLDKSAGRILMATAGYGKLSAF